MLFRFSNIVILLSYFIVNNLGNHVYYNFSHLQLSHCNIFHQIEQQDCCIVLFFLEDQYHRWHYKNSRYSKNSSFHQLDSVVNYKL